MTKQNATAPALIVVNFADHGDLLATSKTFATGSVGYYGNGKIVIDGQAYHVGVTLILVGSTPV